MATLAFNTYEFIKNLKDAGLSEKQAETITTGILKAHDSADVATKGDLREMEMRIKAEMRNSNSRMTIKLGSMLIAAIAAIGVLSVIIKFF